jgi:hypothetical protein
MDQDEKRFLYFAQKAIQTQTQTFCEAAFICGRGFTCLRSKLIWMRIL